MTDTSDKFAPLRKGLLEYAVLTIVSADKVYVADIVQRLSETEFATAEGTLYPLLSRLRRDELVAYEWVESDSGPPRKYYGLTSAGRARLGELRSYWQRLQRTIQALGDQDNE